MGIVVSQLVGQVSIQGAQQAQATLQGVGTSSNQAQQNLNQLQNAAKDVSSILSSRMSAELKNAQSGLQDLAVRADAAGLDVSKFASLQMQAAESSARLGVAQAQAAAAMEKANIVTADASSSVEQVALAQSKAALSAELVQKAELNAGNAMGMVQGEATRLADALEMSQAKGNLFSTAMGGMKAGASGFFGAISEMPSKLVSLGQEIGFTIFGIQQIVQVGQQAAGAFIELGKKAGDFQSSITQLSTGAGELQSNLGMVSQGILKMAPDVGETTKELTAGMFEIEGAGQRGAQGLLTLQDAAEGARISNSSLADTARGVTTEMTDYIAKHISAAQATNTLVAEVKLGQSHMQDMSQALVHVLPDAAKVGVSLTDVSAAMATMTQQGTPAADAATYLRQTLIALDAPGSKAVRVFKEIGLTSAQVSDEMKISLPGALQLITDHLKTKFPEGSAAYISALKDIAGGSKQMQGMMLLTGASLQTFKDDVTGITDAVKKGGTGISGWTQVQGDFNLQMDKAKEGTEVLGITLGTKLFPMFTEVFGWVASTALPALNSFSNWFFDQGAPALEAFFSPLQNVGHWFQDFVGHGQASIPVFAGIGAVIAGIVVPAVWSLAAGVLAATWPALAFGAAIAGVTAIFLHFYNTNAGFKAFMDGMVQAFGRAMDFFTNKAEQTRISVEQSHTKMAIAMDTKTANGAQKAIDNMEVERTGILQKMKETNDPIEKAELDHQLRMLDANEHAQMLKLQKADEDKKKQLAKQKELHAQMEEAQKNWFQRMLDSIGGFFTNVWHGIQGFFGGIGNWFHDRWVDVMNAFGSVGGWFHDKWNEAWGGVTSAFGHVGQWFQDRWHDIQGVFGSIGKWFSDRWTDIMNSTKPFRDYMGAVFQTIWDIISALWGKAGAKFQEWWGDVEKPTAAFVGMIGEKINEAWQKVVGVFQFLGRWFGDRWNDTMKILAGVGGFFAFIFGVAWDGVTRFFGFLGKWFGDRWEDTKKILAPVGQGFHDLFKGAWDKVVAIWSPIGRTFQGWWNDIVHGVEWLGKTIGDKFNDIKTGAANIFKGLVNGIIDQLNNGMSAFVGFINFFAQKLDDLDKSLTGKEGTIPMLTAPKIPHYAQGGEHPGGFAMVGERGREIVALPKGAKVASNDITELLLSMFGGNVPGYAGGIGDLGSKILGWIGGGAKSMLDNLINMFHISSPSILGIPDLGSGIFNKIKDWALSFVESILPKFDFGGTSVPGNVQSWIEAAMSLTHVPGNWAGPLGTIAIHESGGNAAAVNLTDINAQQGHPSQGLFQMIPGTFAAHELAGHTNILNPIDNAASAIGYIKGRYGDVFNVPGIVALAHGQSYVGYANGGVIDEPIAGMGLRTGTRYGFGERGRELVTPYVPSGVNLAQSQAPIVNHIHVTVQSPDFNIDGRPFMRRMMPHMVDEIRYGVGYHS